MEQQTDGGNLQTFEQFLSSQGNNISVVNFLINLLLTGILAYALSLIYFRYGNALSNRRAFGSNFVLIAATTMIIITIVKSSLALSLGLVGALSIVRFRAAIKEPEELAYIFLTIAIGLGMGADQRIITLLGFALIIIYIFLKNFTKLKGEPENLFLTVSTTSSDKETFNRVVEVLRAHSSAVDLKRVEENGSQAELSFIVQYESFEQFNDSKSALKNLDESLTFSFIDNKGMI